MKSEDSLPELVLFLYYTEAWSHQTGQQAPLSAEPSRQPYKANLTVLVLKWRLKDFCQMRHEYKRWNSRTGIGRDRLMEIE